MSDAPTRDERYALAVDMHNTYVRQLMRHTDRAALTESRQGRRWTDIRLFAVDRCPQCGQWRWNKTCPAQACWSQIIHERKTA